jgi:sulfur relay (sulfurtransferase) DsrC/TusE family protein
MLPIDTATDQWTPELARALAAEKRITLTDRHWKAIICWRERAARCGRVPSLNELDECCGFSISELHKLFPGPAAAVLSHIAGVPE